MNTLRSALQDYPDFADSPEDNPILDELSKRK